MVSCLWLSVFLAQLVSSWCGLLWPSLTAQEHAVRVECESSVLSGSLAANTDSECADAGALSRPRVNVCECEYPCRPLGRP